MSIVLLLYVAALICEFCAAVNLPSRVNLMALGLVFWLIALLVPSLR